MARRKQAAEEPAEPEQRSTIAGAVVMVALIAVVFGVLFAWSDAAGILGVVVASTVATWWSVTRRVSDSSAPPPPGEDRPSCRECAGHTPLSATPSQTQKGMWIYTSAPPDRPNHTHVHVVHNADQDA
ncbi:hypothetical protein ACFWR9_08880 [Streptomyces sp. NPDC058534]|uniref:hypothetical protein n=1 Tax=Streptomyces sp. NPDC058534 TaxID=3346541 RepID=UPI003647A71B